MKRKRNESTAAISNKTRCLQNGSHVEVQLDDGKWHSGIILQCQPHRYHVQVEDEQYWIDFELIRPGDQQKRNLPFEYRPGQFLRKESKSTNKIGADEKVVESSNEAKKKRLPRTGNGEQKKASFVWKPSTTSTIQTRRSSRSNQSLLVAPEEPTPIDNRCRTRSLSNSTQQKPTRSSTDVPSPDVLIFRPIIRFVESATNASPDCLTYCSTDDEHLPKPEEYPSPIVPNSKEDDYTESLGPPDLIYHINASTDSRSSSTTSTDNPFLVHPYDSVPSTTDPQIKSEPKSSSFLETPPPSLPDIHLIQDSESLLDKPLLQFKSKRKQDRPQRKQRDQTNGVLDRLLVKQQKDLADPGYLSDEYSEPTPSSSSATKDLLSHTDLEALVHRLEDTTEQSNDLNEDEQLFSDQLITYLHNNNEHYERITKYCSEYYNANPRLHLISQILQRIFSQCYQNKNSGYLFGKLPPEIQTHLRSSFNHVLDENFTKKKIHTRGKRLNHFGEKHRNIKSKRSAIVNMTNFNENLSNSEQQILLSPSSPSTPVSSKLLEQPSVEDLLSPNNTGVMEEISVLPKERDVYEVIHCLCHCEIDNGFMIQCETCLCWSHCECVGVTATCIPAFFKCNICTKAEAERPSQWSPTSIFDDETTSLFLTNSTNAERVALFLSYSRRLWHLREQMIELKLRYTPTLRSLQQALRCDDITELFKYAHRETNELMEKIKVRHQNRQFFQCVAHTLDEIVDTVCSCTSTSFCPSLQLTTTTNPPQTHRLNEQINLLICHLCDDDETRQIRRSIENRYEQLMSTVDKKIQTILHEHQTIQTQMAFELGILPKSLSSSSSDDYLSYDAHEIALRAALERLKC